MIATIDLRSIALAAVGALLLSTACVGAAVGPAHAVETAGIQNVDAVRA